MKNSAQEQAIRELLTRGVEQVVPMGELEKRLVSGSDGRPLRIKHGVDPTGPRLHIGRAITLWKLRAFQELGHQIVLIVGDFTATIGDASDKQAMRQPLTHAQVEENMRAYREQFGKILDMSRVEFRYNSEWLAPLGFAKLVELTQLFTVAQLVERENFWQRFQEKKPIGLHEFLYPLMQGYDSVAIKADVEIGGTDQLFNMMAGRKLQEAHGMPAQDVMTVQMLSGLDGRKMSTSWGNCTYIMDSPTEKFGKIMSMRDESIVEYFTLATDVSAARVADVKAALAGGGVNPRDLKADLAWEVVRRYDGASAADAARAEFEQVFSRGGVPDDVTVVTLGVGVIGVIDMLVATDLAPSRGEAKRLVIQGAVSVDDAVVTDIGAHVELASERLVKVGKRRFIKIKK